ncbi:MAG: hypothetical protein QM790_05505 [Nibricoccus sp.]
MRSFRHSFVRFAVLTLLFASVACLTGCVYLRLLELKKQFARFDQNFVIQPGDDFGLRCLHPVLTGDDLRWLGAEPKTITKWSEGEQWNVRWIKVPAANANESVEYDMEFVARLTNDQLVEAVIPKRYFAYFPKDLFINLLRSTGNAKVDKKDQEAQAVTETPPETPLPNIKSVVGMLGGPTSQSVKAGLNVYVYRYRLDVPAPQTKPVEVTFSFNPDSGDLLKLRAKLAHGTLNYDFTPGSEKKKPPTMHERPSQR